MVNAGSSERKWLPKGVRKGPPPTNHRPPLDASKLPIVLSRHPASSVPGSVTAEAEQELLAFGDVCPDPKTAELDGSSGSHKSGSVSVSSILEWSKHEPSQLESWASLVMGSCAPLASWAAASSVVYSWDLLQLSSTSDAEASGIGTSLVDDILPDPAGSAGAAAIPVTNWWFVLFSSDSGTNPACGPAPTLGLSGGDNAVFVFFAPSSMWSAFVRDASFACLFWGAGITLILGRGIWQLSKGFVGLLGGVAAVERWMVERLTSEGPKVLITSAQRRMKLKARIAGFIGTIGHYKA